MSWRWSAATIVALAAGIIALLLALDVGRWQTAFARDDVRFEAAPTRTDLWQPDEVVPFHAAHCLLGVEDDLAYRRTLRSFWLARPEVNPFMQTNSDQLRSQALVSLAAFLRESRSPHRRGQAANLLGVIGLGLATTDKQGRRLRFPQPMAALIAPAVVIPLAAHALLERRARRVSRQLTLTPPPCRSRLGVPVAIAAVAGLLGLAAAQPVLSGTRTQVGRQDAEAYLLFDTSRSMLAKTDPGAPDRLTRAKRLAQQLRTRLADVPVGIASLTDRMLPHLLPTLDASLFVSSLRDAVGVERPPPAGQGPLATDFSAIGNIGPYNYFKPQTQKRLLVIFSDGESKPFDDRPDADSNRIAAGVADAGGGQVLGEDVGALTAAAKSVIGTGPATRLREQRTQVSLAPFVAVAALLPLGFALLRRNV